MVADYVATLSDAMRGMTDSTGCGMENIGATTLREARNIISAGGVDIVNIHGCWRDQNALLARSLSIMGGAPGKPRLVITPHGQLEPWIRRKHYLRDKLPRTLAYQKRLVKGAYAIIVMGKMERGCMERLKWNERIETVHNALITDMLTEEEMARQLMHIYGKVMDTDTYGLLGEKDLLTLSSLLKASLAGDGRWLTEEEAGSCSFISLTTWRRILLYAHQYAITDSLQRGARVMGIEPPDIRPATVETYNSGSAPTPIAGRPSRVAKADEVVEWIKALSQGAHRGGIHIADLLFTSSQLRALSADEGQISEALKRQGLKKFTNSLMQSLHRQTGLEEGFMINVN